MRHDALIIWGHGLPDLDGVLGLVRATPGFKVRQIMMRDIDDMPRFVRSVYNFDYAPYRHLIDKTRYLLSVPPRAAFIFLDNLEPDEHMVGQGRFAHTECRKMTALKRAIRDRYNPVVDGRPSEHHVVHGTDHAGQTLATLKLLGLKKIDDLSQGKAGVIQTPDHLPPRRQWTLQTIDLSKVYARISSDPGEALPHRVMPIDQTPHALYMKGDREAYESYWQMHRGERLQEDHAPQAFDKLSEQLDYLGGDYPDSYLLVEQLDDERYVLLDGVHRASILRSRSIERVIVAVADTEATKTESDSLLKMPDLVRVFEETGGHDFVVMKSLPSGVPKIGSDIDILCRDKAALGRRFVRNCQALIGEGLSIRLRELAETDQTHLDILRNGRILLRLDLHEGLGAYRRVPVKENYTERLLERRAWAEVACPAGVLRLPVPERVDNLVLRYLEYHEWFDARPDKIKHADHIAEAIADDPATAKVFYERLMQATSRRPRQASLRYCDLNLKRQVVWLYWGVRDKVAWRLRDARNIAVMAMTRPGEFVRKAIRKLTPPPLRSQTLQPKAPTS